MSVLSIEIKARSEHHQKIRDYLLAHGARQVGLDHQIDTYFNVPHGRLKLREGNIENNLIHYIRNNQKGPKRSAVHLYPSTPDSTLKDTLSAALGIKVVVDKQREIYFIDNAKFHLDTVRGLGTFVEIEALDENNQRTAEELEQQCRSYMEAFDIDASQLVSMSYSDLLANRK